MEKSHLFVGVMIPSAIAQSFQWVVRSNHNKPQQDLHAIRSRSLMLIALHVSCVTSFPIVRLLLHHQLDELVVCSMVVSMNSLQC